MVQRWCCGTIPLIALEAQVKYKYWSNYKWYCLGGLGALMFGGPKVNNVLASMTDKIVCATFSADPNLVEEDERQGADEIESGDNPEENVNLQPSEMPTPVSSLALAAAPLLTSNFTFDTRGLSVLNNYSAPNSRRSSDQQEATTPSSNSVNKLSLVGDYANSGALTGVSHIYNLDNVYHRSQTSSVENVHHSSNAGEGYPLSPQVRHKFSTSSVSLTENANEKRPMFSMDADDCSVRSAQVTPKSTPGRSQSMRSPINTDDRDNFTEEVTVWKDTNIHHTYTHTPTHTHTHTHTYIHTYIYIYI